MPSYSALFGAAGRPVNPLWLRWLALSSVIVIIDQITKWAILARFRPGERIPIPPGVDITNNMTYMRENVWNIEAQLLQASIAGIKRANPNAKIVLHAAAKRE